MLEDMFNRNKELTDFLRENAPRGDMPEDHFADMVEKGILTEEEANKYIAEISAIRNSLALYAEVAEYVDEQPWKWWGRGTWEKNRDAAAEELVDILHFLMIAFDDLGCTPEEIYEMYCVKKDTNWERFKKKLRFIN